MLKFFLSVCMISVIYLLSGCSSMPKATMIKGDTKTPQATIEIHNGSVSSSWANNETKAFHNVLEAAALTTIKEGYNYFTIIKPEDISGIDNLKEDAIKKLLKQCEPEFAMASSLSNNSGLHKCGVYGTDARMTIVLYKTQQNNLPLIKAQDVINYLKNNNMYDNKNVIVSSK